MCAGLRGARARARRTLGSRRRRGSRRGSAAAANLSPGSASSFSFASSLLFRAEQHKERLIVPRAPQPPPQLYAPSVPCCAVLCSSGASVCARISSASLAAVCATRRDNAETLHLSSSTLLRYLCSSRSRRLRLLFQRHTRVGRGASEAEPHCTVLYCTEEEASSSFNFSGAFLVAEAVTFESGRERERERARKSNGWWGDETRRGRARALVGAWWPRRPNRCSRTRQSLLIRVIPI